jgi:GNAT superfamily N-acetyltransferase
MSRRHFFNEVSCQSWINWTMKKLFSGNILEPTYIPCKLYGKPLQKSVAGTWPVAAIPENSAEYCRFLQLYFYQQSTNLELKIPVKLLENGLKNKSITGAEIRDKDKILIGVIFDLYAGKYKDMEMGLVTWMCVSPKWRSKGIGSELLFAIYFFSQPRKIQWWRNDGFIKSPLPPFWHEGRIYRKKQIQRTVISGQKQLQIRKSSLDIWKSKIIEQWKLKNQFGLILDDSKFQSEFMELWETKFSPTQSAVLLVQPTFENYRNSKEIFCEIVAWAFSKLPANEYEQAQLIEKMIDHLPYDWFECPATMPHLEEGWKYGSSLSWSCICLDYGTPASKPILSLCIN